MNKSTTVDEVVNKICKVGDNRSVAEKFIEVIHHDKLSDSQALPLFLEVKTWLEHKVVPRKSKPESTSEWLLPTC